MAVSRWAEQGLAPKPRSLPKPCPSAVLRSGLLELQNTSGLTAGLRASTYAQVAFGAQVIETRAASLGAAFLAPGTLWMGTGSHRPGTEQKGP